ncbi:Alpha/Beta hydrolase protein [Paraphysoderma sedebokerense]|nr:Alpha/Beta hydrolase protein [Paraphysoderma sedebokerense]
MRNLLPAEDAVHIPTPDGVSLYAHIHYAQVSSKYRDWAIIFAHPYGPLGGDLNNNVIAHLTSTFAAIGFSTCRFNMRGVPPSTGKTSWTCGPEQNDIAVLIEYLLKEVEQGSTFVDKEGRTWERTKAKKLVLCGYSFGSLTVLPNISHPSVEYAIIIAPPIRYSRFLTLSNYSSTMSLLPDKPKLVILGRSDSFCSVDGLWKWLETVCGLVPDDKETDDDNIRKKRARVKADVCIVENVDHFWFGYEEEISGRCRNWVKMLIEKITPGGVDEGNKYQLDRWNRRR